MKKTNQLVDIAKFFFATCVLMIHSNIFQDNSSIIQYILNHALLRLAVPFFFVCSGYFLGCKINKKDNIIEEKKQ